MASKERSNPINGAQKNILTEWMKDHPELVSGQFTNHFTKKDARKLWETVTITLNAVPGGSNKQWEQWRKSWQDLKKNTKAKNSQIQKYQRGTGGGPPSEIKWSDADAEILALQNPTSLSGNNNSRESAYVFDFGLQLLEHEEDTSNNMHSKCNDESCEENIDGNVVKVISNTLVDEPLTSMQIQLLQKQAVPIKRLHFTESNNETVFANNVKPSDGLESKTATPTPPVKKKKFTTKSSRLDKSLTLTRDLVNNQQSQRQAQERYYKTKIALLRREYKSRASYRAEKIKCKKQANCELRKIGISSNNIVKKFIPDKDV